MFRSKWPRKGRPRGRPYYFGLLSITAQAVFLPSCLLAPITAAGCGESFWSVARSTVKIASRGRMLLISRCKHFCTRLKKGHSIDVRPDTYCAKFGVLLWTVQRSRWLQGKLTVKVIIDPVFYRRRVLIVAMLPLSCRIPEHFAEDLPFSPNL